MPQTKQVSPIQAIPGPQKHEHYHAQIQQLQLETTYELNRLSHIQTILHNS